MELIDYEQIQFINFEKCNLDNTDIRHLIGIKKEQISH